MEINDTWAPIILQSARDSIKYKEILLKNETLRGIEEHEENLMYLGELLSYLTEKYMLNIRDPHPKYITDEKGEKNSVVLPISEFQGIDL